MGNVSKSNLIRIAITEYILEYNVLLELYNFGVIEMGLFDGYKKKSLFNKVVKLDNIGNHEEAIKLYNKSLDLDSEYVDAWNNKGIALNNLEKHQEAIECLKKL